ncbi:HWE histidine kinase domain-containing protein [Consotaella salsifontis]|uniref:histidine kinase n=1 Tax=Consotaella salsifontis TaxID=1365950 RepID=A0A1T4SXE2_9HYPH|nr:HWE histidine kinase domain-containing protein [Consotaella salsifontis]SKA32856.1 Two-component sensor histidine kinase, contains HisKA and HATPase domains [Consotaella salsifontis]
MFGYFGIAEIEPDSERVSASPLFKQLLGFRPQSRLTLRRILTRIDPQDYIPAASLKAEAIVGGKPIFLRVLRPDGHSRSIVIACGRLDNGKVGRLYAIVADVDDLSELQQERAALRQQQFVLGERLHRLNNAFPVVLSVVRVLAEQHETVTDYHAALQERLRAFWTIQQRLLRISLEALDVGDLLRTEMAHLPPSQISLAGPPIVASGNDAEGFGLIIHELVTNAVKHGALSTPAGHLSVIWKVDGENFILEWVETGAPPAQTPPRSGFGMNVIGGDGHTPLCGTAELEFRPEGLWYRLTLSSLVADEPEQGGLAAS